MTTNTPRFTLGLALHVTGTLIREHAYRALGQHFTFDLALRRDHRLVTGGLYSLVRHPGYLGLALNFVGMALCHATGNGRWVWGAGYAATMGYAAVFFARRMRKEDEVLRGAFGKEWEAWAGGTRRIVPYVF